MTTFAPGNLPGVRHLRPRATPGYRPPETIFDRCPHCQRNEYLEVLKRGYRGRSVGTRQQVLKLRCMRCGEEMTTDQNETAREQVDFNAEF